MFPMFCVAHVVSQDLMRRSLLGARVTDPVVPEPPRRPPRARARARGRLVARPEAHAPAYASQHQER